MMRKILAIFALLAGLAPAAAQVPNFPQTLPANTVVGRLGTGPGPSQAIPFAVLTANLFTNTNVSNIFNTAFCSTSGMFLKVTSASHWGCSAISGIDLPNPSTTTLGGVFSLPMTGTVGTASDGQVLGGISNLGVPQVATNVWLKSANAAALAVGRLGNVTPALLVDASAANQITGIYISGQAAGNGVNLSAGGETNVPLIINANGNGVISFGAASTGVVTFFRDTLYQAGKNMVQAGATSGTITVAAPAVSGSNTLTWPAATGTVATNNLDVQTFTSTGANTWTKPAYGKMIMVEIIGAGGGGARRSAGNGGGGGAGCYFRLFLPFSSPGATETVTIGTGGAVQSTDNTDGNSGGSTSFGSFITVFGGRGGLQAAAGANAFGGGSAGTWDMWTTGFNNIQGYLVGQTVVGSVNLAVAQEACAASTGASAANAVEGLPLQTYYGGAGGAGHSTTGPASGVQNTSQKGGNGGAGNGAGNGGNGASPGGGGGSGTTQGGSGGNGKVVVTTW